MTVDSLCPGMVIHLNNVTASNNQGGNIQLNMRDYVASEWEILITNSTITGGNGNRGSGLYYGNAVTDPNGHGAAIKMLKYSVPQFYNHFLPLYQIQITHGSFCNNVVDGTEASVVEFGNIEKASLEDCQFTDNHGTAIAMTSSSIIFTGHFDFDNNTATSGGALRFCDSSAMFLNNNTRVNFRNNHAKQVGGAIFAEEACLAEPKACFFQPVVTSNALVTELSTAYGIKLHFANNTAEVAGDAIYGGEIDHCYTYTK